MKPQIVKKSLTANFLIIIMIITSACAAPTTQILPTGTAEPVTPTLANTSPPTKTSTPEATNTTTNTPLPTATLTPNVTATVLPELTPAVEGKGNVAGLVLWNNQPVTKAAVWLCEKFEGACIGTYQYRTNTDQNGYFVFKNVIPGKYLVAINSFNTAWFMFYFDSDGNREQEVSAGKDLILNPWSIWKIDLHPISPLDGKDISEIHPTFIWEPYPDAAYYQFSIWDINGNTILEDKRVDESEFTLEEVTLVTCNYYWTVAAYNADGMIISQLKAPGSTVMHFINHSVPGSC